MAGALEGKVAIITGGGRGIGRATALRFAREGARVAVNDIDPEPAAETAAAIVSAGGEALANDDSVTTLEGAQRMVEATIGTFGKLDILVNNAGVVTDAWVHRMSDEQWNRIMTVNLNGPFNCIRAAASYLREASKRDLDSGHPVHRKIINLASVNGIYGAPGQTAYASAKAGVIGFTKSLAREWAPFRINVNAVAPGFIETRLTATKEEGGALDSGTRARIVAQIPIGRAGRPEDIAGLITFLASPDADYLTGQVIEMHGGLEIVRWT